MSEPTKPAAPAKIDGVPMSMINPSVMERMFGTEPTPRQGMLLLKIQELNYTRRAQLLHNAKPTDVIPARLIEQLHQEQMIENKQRGVTKGALDDTTMSSV
jgi:hypothetical protein